MDRTYIATHQDGSQTLVTLWDDDKTTTVYPAGEITTRPDKFSRWGVPTELAADES